MNNMEPFDGAATDAPADFPPAWSADLAGYSWVRQSGGCSGAAVFRLQASDRPLLFVKTESVSPFGELRNEAARLHWLAQRGIDCPRVLAEAWGDDRDWLLMSGVPGIDLASSRDLEPQEIVDIVADALRALHQLDITTCPFDHRLDVRIAAARARMEAGLVDEEDFDEHHLQRTARDLFEELLARRPRHEDLVLAHGDAYFSNLLADNGCFTGFVDCARLGVADRHQDLALACASIESDLGERWIEPFLQRYGAGRDSERLAYYRLLDEFF